MIKKKLPICLSVIVVILIFCSCQNKTLQEKFTPITDQEVYDVVNALAKQERLDTINFNKERPLKIIDSLEESKVYFPKRIKQLNGGFIALPSPSDGIEYQQLISNKFLHFTFADSSYFVYQNQNQKRLILKLNKFNQIEIITRGAYDQNLNKGIICSLLTISVPIFSKDHRKAYITSGFHCGGLCGNGKEFFLIKINGNWLVKGGRRTWIS